ncbi:MULTISPECIES: PKD domain-containing protein [unclassified Imperialibacter]|uniref:PKD domain-containing protein n=1 Tax=unclassified Imperialibacter TaxID=2629706 RepID=UPI00125328EF|nr:MULTISPECIES: PKD domain-containing protein [unclassified Imperialibacter]CAD5258625.1 conserved exported hypothetical protein [Imperialibacter sp. 75]CAD5261763.1 conserved exported hypothetical protein [Imperialibacter sp. 89]VVT24501.1 exported hypothetical protein [Imperialibacter sp. EC-SDR9]
MTRFTLAVLMLLVSSCLDPLEAPAPDWQPQTFADGMPNLAFRLRVSGISPGSVRFNNYSSGMHEFTWYLGYNNENGIEATTNTPAPTLKYPRNGRFNVRLKGIGTDSTVYWGSDWIEISNLPD